jgi:hypothetical protein
VVLHHRRVGHRWVPRAGVSQLSDGAHVATAMAFVIAALQFGLLLFLFLR